MCKNESNRSEEVTGYYFTIGNKTIEKFIPVDEAKLLYVNNISGSYPSSFYKSTAKCRVWQKAIGNIVGRILKIKSAVDFGCGLGCYLEGFKVAGAEMVKGFEASYDLAKDYMSKDILDQVSYGNAMDRVDCGKFDLSMSIEVAEHILPDKSEIFIDNLVSASRRYILFTAAPPGQGGTCHINEREGSFWIDLFKNRGFVVSKDDVEKIKNELNSLPRYGKYFNLIKRQIMLFVKNETGN